MSWSRVITADLMEGARKGAVLYLRMAEWAIRPQGSRRFATGTSRRSMRTRKRASRPSRLTSSGRERRDAATVPYLTAVIAVTDIGVVRPITTSPTLIFFSISCVAIERAE